MSLARSCSSVVSRDDEVVSTLMLRLEISVGGSQSGGGVTTICEET